ESEHLEHVVARLVETADLRRRVARLETELSTRHQLVGLSSAAMAEAVSLARRAAASQATVLLRGESGTGKEVLARFVHAHSARAGGPFVAVNCATLGAELLESELFGHERGAFTGAQYRKKGKFEVADGGTIFLDEIGDISLKTQTDLLRVLQEKEIVRVGGTQSIPVNFRCVAATNKDLAAMVKDGTFRPDLYYRLNVFTIHLPPLRERREDIPLLVEHFLAKHAAAMNKPVPRISAAAMDLLLTYPWPGNVRELENAVERALVIGRGAEIQPGDFPFQQHPAEAGPERTLEEVERAHIARVLEETGWNLSRTARILDIDRTTLYHKLRRYGLKRNEQAS
ncbi:MAG TPA: sigma-54 dependent transcriptional regulator, partial [Candidatus Xenobia bacterium]|nr:sigma-54 dependent transcriptional regulator [Candidatus Xenobia bacterium]